MTRPKPTATSRRIMSAAMQIRLLIVMMLAQQSRCNSLFVAAAVCHCLEVGHDFVCPSGEPCRPREALEGAARARLTWKQTVCARSARAGSVSAPDWIRRCATMAWAASAAIGAGICSRFARTSEWLDLVSGARYSRRFVSAALLIRAGCSCRSNPSIFRDRPKTGPN